MLAKKIDELRKEKYICLPDGKVQVTIKNSNIEKIIINVQHEKNANMELLREIILKEAVSKVVDSNNQIIINKDLGFIKGGFTNDTGLTGRKIMVDTYGGLVPHGGGAFSGKDPSKMDRTGAYMARFVAKSIVANGIAKECLVMLAYEFGEEKPAAVKIICDGNSCKSILREKILDEFDLRPEAIIERLGLRKIKFINTSTYGHFGDKNYPWEKIVSL